MLDIMEVLQNNPDMKVTVTGHTDNRGSYEYNVTLGERRADAAKKFMVSCTSYLENRIKTASRGETEPLVYVQGDLRIPSVIKGFAIHNNKVAVAVSGIYIHNSVFTVTQSLFLKPANIMTTGHQNRPHYNRYCAFLYSPTLLASQEHTSYLFCYSDEPKVFADARKNTFSNMSVIMGHVHDSTANCLHSAPT
ncbi:Outer membrane protein pal-like [Dirofilaria immitis]|nr:Outer membrane protein pal-like [Dirofilaria immitis]